MLWPAVIGILPVQDRFRVMAVCGGLGMLWSVARPRRAPLAMDTTRILGVCRGPLAPIRDWGRRDGCASGGASGD